MKTTCAIILDTRSTKLSGKCPAKIRVTFNRKHHYYPIGLDFTEEEYYHMQNPSQIPKTCPPGYKKHLGSARLDCNKKLVLANSILEKMTSFDKRLFDMRFHGTIKPAQTLIEYYQQEIDYKMKAGNIGTSGNYKSSLRSLLSFRPNLSFSDVTPEFLRQYESWFLENGKSISTVGIYLRPLRAIIIKAIEDMNFSRESYPFGRRRYQIPTSKNIKKALSKAEIRQIVKYNSSNNDWHQKARDFFIFSYLANGMNMKDILQLKGENIDGEFIRFKRAKTQGTIRTGSKPITVPICDELKKIMERWGKKNPKADEYIFSVLEIGLTPKRVKDLVQQFIKMINKYIKVIALELGIEKPITTYFARHSYATILRKSGASTEFISEALGHSNIATTSSYLDSFDDDIKKQMHQLLTQFI